MSSEDDSPTAAELALRLQHSARLASVGKLASSAAHEINQPLNVIRMAAFNVRRAIQKGTLDPESALVKLERIDSQIARAARLVGGMKAFSPTTTDAPTAVSPTDVLTTALQLMAKRFTAADVELIHEPRDGDETVQAAPSAFQELVIHLLDNAIEAYSEAPQRNPLLEGDNLAPRWVKVGEAVQEQEFIITIEDAAGGLSAEIVDRAFLPFVTTAQDGSHAGLGLTVCASLAASMGGAVMLDPTDLGLVATVRLPLKAI
ncbi:MAG: ATP-binding protein [Luminiphilus sp.]|nr:ATP-binding protein [Luminiphilus sp.]